MRKRLWIAVPVLIAAIALGGAALWIPRYLASRSSQPLAMEKIEAENRELRARAERLAVEAEAARRGASAPPPQVTATPPAGHEALPPGALDQARLLISLREKLASTQSTIDDLQLRIQQLEGQVEHWRDENGKLAASEREMNDQLGAANRVVDAVQAELRAKQTRLTQMEVSFTKLREDNRAASARSAEMAGAASELEDMNRRRESQLNVVLRRYREITEQYRAWAGRIENDSSAGADLARIQNAISLAEEDLRQLSALNAQAARLIQRIARR
jgi:chromosome segregation ATPase